MLHNSTSGNCFSEQKIILVKLLVFLYSGDVSLSALTLGELRFTLARRKIFLVFLSSLDTSLTSHKISIHQWKENQELYSEKDGRREKGGRKQLLKPVGWDTQHEVSQRVGEAWGRWTCACTRHSMVHPNPEPTHASLNDPHIHLTIHWGKQGWGIVG